MTVQQRNSWTPITFFSVWFYHLDLSCVLTIPYENGDTTVQEFCVQIQKQGGDSQTCFINSHRRSLEQQINFN